MKIFASWSGDLSHRVAMHLKVWLEDVLQGSNVWVSSENIEKGSVWFSDVSDTLKDTAFGLLCVTRQNLSAPWLLFEAGALSKGLNSSRVSPLLVDLGISELKAPLSLLNATLPNEEDMMRLVRTINAHSVSSRLPDDRLERAFRRCWPEFMGEFDQIIKTSATSKPAPKRTDRELIEEISENLKFLYKAMQDSAASGRDIVFPSVRELELRLVESETRMSMMEKQLHAALAERARLQEHVAEFNLLRDRMREIENQKKVRARKH